MAEASLARQNEKLGGKVVTEIEQARRCCCPCATSSFQDAACWFVSACDPDGRTLSCLVLPILQINNYWEAEEYHQRYLEKGGRNGRAQSAAKGCNDPIRCYG